jgi:hypothetical protein
MLAIRYALSRWQRLTRFNAHPNRVIDQLLLWAYRAKALKTVA